MPSPNTIALRDAQPRHNQFARVLISYTPNGDPDKPAVPSSEPGAKLSTRDGAVYTVTHTGALTRQFKAPSRRDLIRRCGGKKAY